MTDRIKDLETKAGGYEADRLPYVQVMATLELARQQHETNVQLKRIADVLEKQAPARSPSLREMTRNSLASDTDKYRNPPAAAHLAAIDEALAEVSGHSCTNPTRRHLQGCCDCRNKKDCNDEITF